MPPAFDFRSLIRTVPDFPRAGVRFRDITTLLKDGAVFHAVVDEIASAYRTSSVGKVAAIEARGFIVGAAVAHALRAGLVPVRKQGKLPAECLGRDYTLEYGVDRLECTATPCSRASVCCSSTISSRPGERPTPRCT